MPLPPSPSPAWKLEFSVCPGTSDWRAAIGVYHVTRARCVMPVTSVPCRPPCWRWRRSLAGAPSRWACLPGWGWWLAACRHVVVALGLAKDVLLCNHNTAIRSLAFHFVVCSTLYEILNWVFMHGGKSEADIQQTLSCSATEREQSLKWRM